MNNDLAESYHAFLESLKGKTVTIYRGGPESKTGLLLDVKGDYVTLYSQNNNNNNNQNNQQNNQQNNNNQNSVIYYQAKHVKSISEDSITNSTQTTQVNQENVEFLKAEDFVGLIKNLLKETIQINQGGPESKYGTLLGVSNDFIAIYTEDDGIVYFNVNHVKSVSKYQDNNNQNDQQTMQNNNNQQVYPEIIEATNFQNVFQHLAHKWVSINRGGPEAMEGVLVENVGGHYTLVSNQEVLRIHPYHIKSISSGPKGSLSENNQSDNSSESEQTDQTVQNSIQNNSNEKKSNQNNSNSKSKNREKKSSSSRNSELKREKVVKTIDYVWKGIK